MVENTITEKKQNVQSEPSSAAPNRKSAASEFRNLVRIIDVDIPGDVSIFMAMTKVKGISFMLIRCILTEQKSAEISRSKK